MSGLTKAVAFETMWGVNPPDTEHSLFVSGHREHSLAKQPDTKSTD